MTDRYWAVAQVFSSREHKIRPDIEATNHGTFVPTYARMWSRDGKPNAKECVLMPGYCFFLAEGDSWGNVSGVDGVIRVLTATSVSDRIGAGRVTDGEMNRMMLDHAMGVHNRIEIAPQERRESVKRRRRPRPSKRARMKARQEIAA